MTRHHYVPQMYLRRFANAAKEVVLVDRDDLTKFEAKTAKQAMQLDDFYGWNTGNSPEDVDDPAMLDPEYIENLLGVFESRAAGPFDRIIGSGEPPQIAKDRYHLSQYVALQAARGLRFREDLTQLATLTMRRHLRSAHNPEHVRVWLEERGAPHEPDDVDAFVQRAYGPDGPRLVPDQAIAIQQSLGFAFQHLVPALWACSWLVLTFDEPCLVTSDEPAVAFHPDDEPITAMNAPFVLFAMDRRHLLAMRKVEADQGSGDSAGFGADPGDSRTVSDASAQGRPEHAAQYNSLVATQAERHIVHHPDDAHLLGDLTLGPRTAWVEEVVETVGEGDEVIVRAHARRRPVAFDDGAPNRAGAERDVDEADT